MSAIIKISAGEILYELAKSWRQAACAHSMWDLSVLAVVLPRRGFLS